VTRIDCLLKTALILTLSVSTGRSIAQETIRLIPYPVELIQNGRATLERGVAIDLPHRDSEDGFTASDLKSSLAELGVNSCRGVGCFRIVFLRTRTEAANRKLARAGLTFSKEMQQEGYALVSDGQSMDVIASSSVGLFYGAQTVKQLVDVDKGVPSIALVNVRDWPAMRYRAIDDDLSRGPIPTVDYQKEQIRKFAAYKLNIYSPYFENALEHPSTPITAAAGGAMSSEDVGAIVAYAKLYHIEVIPEQEAFGHLHGVLQYDQFSDLAETSHGSVLAPGKPESLNVIHDWFGDIAKEFPSSFVHIGADETFELGRGQSSATVQQNGIGKVYIGFLNAIHAELQPYGKRLLFWGDIARNQPALLRDLPKDMIAVPWWYDPQPKGFDTFITPFRDAGMETWVAPGVNNWDRVYPNNDMALRNIQGFVRDGQRLGATGMFNTVWNDDGEGLFESDWYGVLFGAAAGWQKGESDIPRFESSYGYVFHRDQTGKINEAQQELMAAHRLIQSLQIDAYPDDASDSLFWVDPWSPEGQSLSKRLLPILHKVRIHAENAITLVREAKRAAPLRETDALDAIELGAYRLDTIGLKFEEASEISQIYQDAYAHESESPRRVAGQRPRVELDLMDISDIQGRCQDLRNAYSESRQLYQSLWLRENRPYALQNVLARYDIAIQLWTARGDKFQDVLHHWQATNHLPTQEEVGLPK
jgi:hexosaminidase